MGKKAATPIKHQVRQKRRSKINLLRHMRVFRRRGRGTERPKGREKGGKGVGEKKICRRQNQTEKSRDERVMIIKKKRPGDTHP